MIFIFVTISALSNMLIAERTIAIENSVEAFWWQVSWRIPGLRPDTTLITLYPDNSVVDNFELGLVEPVNLLYFSDHQTGLPIRYPVSTLMPTNENVDLILSQRHRKMYTYRTHETVVTYDNILVLSQPTPASCVRVIDGKNYIFSVMEPENVRKIGPFSNIENVRIHIEATAKKEYALGKEPDKKWCYYFEKVDLAVQQQNWEQAVMLGDVALSFNLYPTDQVEWFPFIQSYAMVGNVSKLEMISLQTNSNIYFNKQVCEAFRRSNSILNLSLQIRNFIEELFCI